MGVPMRNVSGITNSAIGLGEGGTGGGEEGGDERRGRELGRAFGVVGAADGSPDGVLAANTPVRPGDVGGDDDSGAEKTGVAEARRPPRPRRSPSSAAAAAAWAVPRTGNAAEARPCGSRRAAAGRGASDADVTRDSS
jgi:hypothetical protein